MAILILAANTAFADFPRLSSFLARDSFLPRQFAFRGDRSGVHHGHRRARPVPPPWSIIFGADTNALIPLYAVGVFIAFTRSQSGMVRRWPTRREPGWQRGTLINGVGALTCGVVAIVTAATKFSQGAWIILLIIPAIVLTLHLIHRHYTRVAEELVLDPTEVTLRPPVDKPIVIVPMPSLHLGVLPALDFARALSDNVTAVHVTDDLRSAEASKTAGKSGHRTSPW